MDDASFGSGPVWTWIAEPIDAHNAITAASGPVWLIRYRPTSRPDAALRSFVLIGAGYPSLDPELVLAVITFAVEPGNFQREPHEPEPEPDDG